MTGHCGVKISESEILITGGKTSPGTGSETAETWIYDFKTEEYKPGPSMIYARHRHGCTKFKSKFYDNRPVVLVIDHFGEPDEDTIEILDYTVSGSSWRECKCIYIPYSLN